MIFDFYPQSLWKHDIAKQYQQANFHEQIAIGYQQVSQIDVLLCGKYGNITVSYQ